MSDENKNIPEEEMDENIIELTDDEGNTVRFEYLTTVDHEGELYIVVMEETDDEDQAEEGEVVIMKIEKDEETGDDIYVTVDDEEIGQAVFDKFMAMLDDEADE